MKLEHLHSIFWGVVAVGILVCFIVGYLENKRLGGTNKNVVSEKIYLVAGSRFRWCLDFDVTYGGGVIGTTPCCSHYIVKNSDSNLGDCEANVRCISSVSGIFYKTYKVFTQTSFWVVGGIGRPNYLVSLKGFPSTQSLRITEFVERFKLQAESLESRPGCIHMRRGKLFYQEGPYRYPELMRVPSDEKLRAVSKILLEFEGVITAELANPTRARYEPGGQN